jgi:hypothetical protein
MTTKLKSDFIERGFYVIRNLLSLEEVREYKSAIIKLSGIGDDDFSDKVFECPDGVSKNREFWPLIYHHQLISTIRELLGPTARYTQHSDLHAHRTGGWHRDCACRKYGVGPDWDTSGDPYRVVRVAIYLQTFQESSSSLGVVPGSHRFEQQVRGRALKYWRNIYRANRLPFRVAGKLGLCPVPAALDERMTMWTKENYNPYLTWPSTPKWIKTEPGDCIIFDQRLYHSASPIHGPKYAIYLSYSPENQHAINHMGYYRYFRKDLGYENLSPELADILREKNLFLDAPPPEKVDGFFINGTEVTTG